MQHKLLSIKLVLNGRLLQNLPAYGGFDIEDLFRDQAFIKEFFEDGKGSTLRLLFSNKLAVGGSFNSKDKL